MYMVLCCHLCRSTCKAMCLQMQPLKGWSNIFWMNVTYVEWCSICFWQLQVDSLSQPMLLERAVGGVRRCCRWIDKNAKLTFITYGVTRSLIFWYLPADLWHFILYFYCCCCSFCCFYHFYYSRSDLPNIRRVGNLISSLLRLFIGSSHLNLDMC